MFISCIDYINKVKIGNFAEHSNQLWGISSVPTWTKINAGLVKMYQKEVSHWSPNIAEIFLLILSLHLSLLALLVAGKVSCRSTHQFWFVDGIQISSAR